VVAGVNAVLVVVTVGDVTFRSNTAHVTQPNRSTADTVAAVTSCPDVSAHKQSIHLSICESVRLEQTLI